MRMRWFHIGLVVLMFLVPVRRAEAAPIFFDFTLDFTTGVLAGQSYQGALSVEGDDCTGIGGACEGTFTAPGGSLLSFDVTVDGSAFSLGNALGNTSIRFVNDNIVDVGYLGEHLPSFHLLGVFGSSAVFSGPSSAGRFISEGRRETDVPEPASMLLLGIGLAGASGRRWRQSRP